MRGSRVLAALVLFALACAGPEARDEAQAGWRVTAAQARASRVDAADRALDALDADGRAEVEAVLDRMAGFGTGPDALRRAGAMAEGNAGIAQDPDWEGSGTAPGTRALHEGALAVLLGMATASAREAPERAGELVEAICAMPMPVYFNSGGRMSDMAERRTLADAVVAELPAGTTAPPRGDRCVAP